MKENLYTNEIEMFVFAYRINLSRIFDSAEHATSSAFFRVDRYL